MKKILIFLLLLSTCGVYGQVNFKQVFKNHGAEGSITIYDRGKMQWLYSDSLDATRGTLPGSTFDLINSCIALETGVIKTENELVKTDGKTSGNGRKTKVPNQDTDLKTAFEDSDNSFYIALAKRIGRKDYIDFLKSFHYGNLNYTEKGDDFWNAGPLGVSPKDQVNFLRAFSTEQLSFSPRTFIIVKKLLGVQKSANYTLVDKTGWAKANGKDISWQIGYVTSKGNTYYFATRLIKPSGKTNTAFTKTGKEITMDILKQLKVINP